MKRTFILFLSVLFLVFPYFLRGENLPLACVDIQRVMMESEKGKEMQRKLKEEAEKMKKELDARQEELQRLRDTLDKQAMTLSEAARAEKEKLYQSKLKEYQRIYSDYQNELQNMDAEYSQEVLREIQEIINMIGEKEKYALIIEKDPRLILYNAKYVDITDKVIALYNESVKQKGKKK